MQCLKQSGCGPDAKIEFSQKISCSMAFMQNFITTSLYIQQLLNKRDRTSQLSV